MGHVGKSQRGVNNGSENWKTATDDDASLRSTNKDPDQIMANGSSKQQRTSRHH